MITIKTITRMIIDDDDDDQTSEHKMHVSEMILIKVHQRHILV